MRTMRMQSRSAVALAALLLSGGAGPAARAQGAPPEEPGRFRLPLAATAPAATYDVTFSHYGLAAADGRDIRVVDAGGKPVSHVVSFANGQQARILFDGSAGPGVFTLTFGTLRVDMPPVPPDGLVLFGRVDWRPEGGFSCTTYKSVKPRAELKPRLMTGGQVLETVDAIRAEAEARQAELDRADEKARKAAVPWVLHTRFVNSQGLLPVDPGEELPGPNAKPVKHVDRFVHVFRAEIELPEAQEVLFVVDQGDSDSPDLKLLVVDGDRKETVVNGWYRESYGLRVTTGTGSRRLTAGPHVLELYTFLSVPDLKMRLGSPNAPLEAIDGRYARFAHSARLSPGALQARDGSLADACWSLLDAWLGSGQYTRVRLFARDGAALIAVDAAAPARLQAMAADALDAINSRLWIMESKTAARTGVAAAPGFQPPLRLAAAGTTDAYHDFAGLSSAVWTESGLIYGLPFPVFEEGWGVTSGTCFQDGVIYAGLRNGRMVAADYASTKLKWFFPGEGSCRGTPLLYRGVLYYGTLDRRLYALDADRGRMLWNFPTRGWIEGSPAAAAGTVYFGSADGFLYAVDAGLGVERWKVDLGGRIAATPACADNRVFVGTLAGTFSAVQADSGARLWTFKAEGPIEGGACVDAGAVSFGDHAGRVYRLNAADGAPLWPQPCRVPGPVTAAPILAGSVLYGGTANGAAYWGIDAAEGFLGWTQPVAGGGDVHRPALFADGHLVFTSRLRKQGHSAMRGAVATFVSAEPAAQTVFMTDGPLRIDGRLAEQAWQKAAPLSVFFKSNGMGVSNAVDACLLWATNALYVGLTIRDPDLVRGEDAVTLLLDARRDGLAVARFRVPLSDTPTATLLAATCSDPANLELKQQAAALKLDELTAAFAPVWQSATTTNGTIRAAADAAADVDTGWTAELAIPFASLPADVFPPPANGHTWHINLLVDSRGNGAAPAPELRRLCLTPTADAEGTGARWTPLRWDARKAGEGK